MKNHGENKRKGNNVFIARDSREISGESSHLFPCLVQ